MQQVSPFQFDGNHVRVIEQDGASWFVAADVCEALGLSNPSMAIRALDEDERSKFNLGRQGDAALISESGLYTIILRCRDAVTPGSVAHRFRKWVTVEVLPTLRKKGSYGAPDAMKALNDPTTLRSLLTSYSERVLTLESQVEEMQPDVDALERIAKSDGSLCITDAAKTLQVRPKSLFLFLRSHRWIYTRAGSNQEIAHQDRLASGLLEHKTTTVSRSDGSEKTVTQVRVTPKGLARLAKEFPPVLSLVS